MRGFEELFDWEKESNSHYYSMLQAYHDAEEFEKNMILKPIKIEVKNESNIDLTRKVRRPFKKVLQLRSHLFVKALRAKSGLK